MKKSAAILSIFGLIIFAVSCKKEQPRTTMPALVIQSLIGDVTIARGDTVLPGTIGLSLDARDVIVTEKHSTVDILFGSGGVIRMNEMSKLAVASVSSTEQSVDAGLVLEKGKVFASISKMQKSSSMSVKTRTAIAAVRGTTFRVSSDEKGSTVDVLAGKIQVNPVVDERVIETVSTVIEKDKTASISTVQAKEMSLSPKKEISVKETPVEVKAEIKTESAGITVAKGTESVMKEELASLGIQSTEVEPVAVITRNTSTPAPAVDDSAAKKDATDKEAEKARKDKADKEQLAKQQKIQAEKDRVEHERIAKEKADADRKKKEQDEKDRAAKEKEQKESRVKNVPNI